MLLLSHIFKVTKRKCILIRTIPRNNNYIINHIYRKIMGRRKIVTKHFQELIITLDYTDLQLGLYSGQKELWGMNYKKKLLQTAIRGLIHIMNILSQGLTNTKKMHERHQKSIICLRFAHTFSISFILQLLKLESKIFKNKPYWINKEIAIY